MASETAALSRPPLNILVNPEVLPTHRPWQVDIAQLLQLFLRIIEHRELLDLRLCGTAALSSALLYRFKVETLFLFERLRVQRASTELGEPPHLLQLPFRYELPATALEDLLQTLQRILLEAEAEPASPHEAAPLLEPQPIIEFDPFEANTQELLQSFREELLHRLRSRGTLLFRRFTHGKPLREEVRAFILLLFVAMQGLIALAEEADDIRITLVTPDVGR